MRAIQSWRISRLRRRRSRNAYASACSTASLAGRKSSFLESLKPFARSRIALWRRCAGTPRLTLAMGYLPRARRTVFRSAFDTGCSVWSLRLCSFDFWCRRWLIHELRRTSFPFRVARMRLAIPLRVLSLGTVRRLLGRACRAGGGQDHEQVPALEQWRPLHDRELARIIGHPIEDLAPDLLVHHLATPEHDRHLHLLAGFEELLQPLELGLKVVLRHFWTQLHLFQLDDVLLAPLVLFALDGLELEASVIHQAADRRAGLRRHLHEVEALYVFDAQRSVQGKHA